MGEAIETHVIEWPRGLFEVYGTDKGEGALPPSRDVYYAWVDGESNPWLLHYCRHLGADALPEHRDRWVWAGTALHTLVAREPLHLEPSIGWMECCGRHGWIRGGQWEPSGDGGWMPE